MARTTTTTTAATTAKRAARAAARPLARPADRQAKAAPKKTAPAAKSAAVALAAPTPKAPKLVRDSFTMPQQDFALIATLKQRAIVLQRPVKKSELLRAGLQALQRLPDDALLASLQGLLPIKTGRPKKG